MQKGSVLILGGGISGLISAIASARAGDHPLILEKLDQPGKKLLATGNGRCNLMNLHKPVYYGDPDFADAVLGTDPVEKLTDFWKSLGLFLRYDADGRGYPCTFSAATVLEVIKSELKHQKVNILTGRRVTDISVSDAGYRVQTENEEIFEADRMIISTGGAAQPKLGGNLDAWPWLSSLGHTMISANPALTPLITEPRTISGLSGIRARCQIQLWNADNLVLQEKGELLFTEKGISGICAMQCARFIMPGKSECRINLLSELFSSEKDLYLELAARRNKDHEGSPPELLRGLCPPKLAYAVCKQAGLQLKGEKNGALTSIDLHKIANTSLGYRIKIIGTEGFERAQVMAGGVNCKEIRPDNLESLLQPGLHITGELLNVDGDCGGFNIMFACMSGLRAGWNRRNQHIC